MLLQDKTLAAISAKPSRCGLDSPLFRYSMSRSMSFAILDTPPFNNLMLLIPIELCFSSIVKPISLDYAKNLSGVKRRVRPLLQC